MALLYADFVRESTTTTGTGTYDLAAVSGFNTFVAGIGTLNSCYYGITDDVDWEIGEGGVVAGAPDTLARLSILASSNSDAAVNWGAGTKRIYCTYPASIIATVRTDLDLKAPITDPTFIGEIGIGAVNVSETELGILEGATPTTAQFNFVTGVTSAIQTQLDAKAPLASPTLTGVPAAPTAAPATNTTQIATTAFVFAGLALKAAVAGSAAQVFAVNTPSTDDHAITRIDYSSSTVGGTLKTGISGTDMFITNDGSTAS